MRNRKHKKESYHSQSKPGASFGISQQFKTGVKTQPVQRFPSVAQFYKLGDIASMEDQLTFETQDLSRDENGYGARYTQTTTRFSEENFRFDEVTNDTNSGGQLNERQGIENPRLKISGNELLAIHHTEQQPKEFFAASGLVQESNTRLKSADSSVVLKNEGAGLRVNQDGPDLLRIVPGVSQENSEDVPEKLVALSSDECNQVMNDIIGRTGRVLILLDNKGRKLEAERPFGQEPSEKIRSYLADNNYVTGGEGLREKIETKGVSEYEESGPQRYSRKSEFIKNQQAETLGMNEHAKPETGEGYVLTSSYPKETLDYNRYGIPTEEYFKAVQELQNVDEGKDAQQQNISAAAKSLMETWFVHYATVMAKDGDDTITLENYNRTPERDWAIRRVFNKLLLDFAEFRDYVSRKAETLNLLSDSTQAKELVAQLLDDVTQEKEDLDNNLHIALQQAQLSFDQDLEVQQDKMRQMLFFQMYGPGDQSFHKKYTPQSSNPTTFRTGNSFSLASLNAKKSIDDLSGVVSGIFKNYRWNKHICEVWIDAVFQSQVGGPIREAGRLIDMAVNMATLNKAKAESLDLIKNTFTVPPQKFFYFINLSLGRMLGTDKNLEINKLNDAFLMIEIGKQIVKLGPKHISSKQLISEFEIKDPKAIEAEDLVSLEQLLTELSNQFGWFSYK